MQWLLIHVTNFATFVGTLCIHVCAPTGTLAYYYEDPLAGDVMGIPQ